MTKVDFYVLPANGMSREQLACRLTEKAWNKQHHIYIHTGSVQEAQRIDDLLWTFNQDSFLPHNLVTDAASVTAPIRIGYEEAPDMECDVLINLSHEVPAFFSRFMRIAELVDQNKNTRNQARERFRFYRERGYPLDSHELTA